jgi:hypothetical protein
LSPGFVQENRHFLISLQLKTTYTRYSNHYANVTIYS